MEWELLIDDGRYEWWLRRADNGVWRRKLSEHNFTMPDGTPNALRYEGSLEWFVREARGMIAQ